MSLVLETTLGDLQIDLYVKNCPTLCYNFMKLCKIKYYNFSLFHSIQKNFVAQTGDPSGLGNGGSSVFGIIDGPDRRYFKETKAGPMLKHTTPGLLSMVNCGDDMFGSQFIITLGSGLHSLDGKHLVFGEVVDGLEVLIKFNDVITDTCHRPYKDVRITRTVIIDDPFEDPDRLIVPSRSPSPNEETLQNSRLDPDKCDSSDELSETDKVERVKDKDAQAQATILEIIGDLPSYKVAPPENVLFVCHLNPITTDEDLEIIFSRFGTVKNAEVIRDKKSGNSLQYAFVEFGDKRACEEAYLKMEGVLIDERRIHVDFSQSVSKNYQRGEVSTSSRGDRKGAGDTRRVTPRDRDRPERGVQREDQQSGKTLRRKESRRDDDGRTSRKHDSRRRRAFGCGPSCKPRGDGSCTCKERWQNYSKSREEKKPRKQIEYVQKDKTERGSSRYTSHSEGSSRRHSDHSSKRAYDESGSKEHRRVPGRAKQ